MDPLELLMVLRQAWISDLIESSIQRHRRVTAEQLNNDHASKEAVTDVVNRVTHYVIDMTSALHNSEKEDLCTQLVERNKN